MKRLTVWMLAGTMGLGWTACSGGGGTAPPPEETAKEPVVSAHAVEVISWESEWDAAVARAKKENKPILVDFYADWCVWCKTLDSTTYKDPAVARLLGEKMVPLKVDVDHGGRELARQWGVSGLPTILVLSPNGKELGRIPGYLPARDFMSEVQRFAGI